MPDTNALMNSGQIQQLLAMLQGPNAGTYGGDSGGGIFAPSASPMNALQSAGLSNSISGFNAGGGASQDQIMQWLQKLFGIDLSQLNQLPQDHPIRQLVNHMMGSTMQSRPGTAQPSFGGQAIGGNSTGGLQQFTNALGPQFANAPQAQMLNNFGLMRG